MSRRAVSEADLSHLKVDRDRAIPIYLQIARQISEAISSGSLPAGTRLPPERQLARALGVNRSTVLSAYRNLKESGLLEAIVGRGTSVLRPPAAPPDLGGRQPFWEQLFRQETGRAVDAVVRDLLALSERRDVIPMAIGLPSPDHLPLELYRDLLRELTAEIGPPLLLHCPTEGITPLRERLSQYMEKRGIGCVPSEVLVLAGSQQGLDLIGRTLLEPGDTVIVEEPTYIGALETFRAAGCRMIGVPCDDEGLCTDMLEPILERHRPKLIYTLPTFQNPSGAVMTLERRRHLVDLAARHRIPIVEDDPYSELRYDGRALPSLKALDRAGLVLYLSTFSKLLFPGLRLGWMAAPAPVIHRLALVKQTVDLHSSTPAQWLLERFIRDGHLEKHVARMRGVYAEKRDRMHHALTRCAPDGFTWRRPDGGFYLWCRLPERVDRSRLLARAAEAGVSFLPGWFCFHQDPGASHLRLNFSNPSPEQIESGIPRLIDAVRAGMTRPPTVDRETIGTPPIV